MDWKKAGNLANVGTFILTIVIVLLRSQVRER
jgi:hypothetical protein